jgi:hypothetical protein
LPGKHSLSGWQKTSANHSPKSGGILIELRLQGKFLMPDKDD